MKNIRLYIGGQRADLDASVNIPFTFQTTDAEMPTATKNSYSKTVVLQGTENNRRLFGGIWRLDSRIVTEIAGTPAQYMRWNQLVNHGNFDSSSGWSNYTSNTTRTISDGVCKMTVNTGRNPRNPMQTRLLDVEKGHKVYVSLFLKITAATAVQFRPFFLYTPSQYLGSVMSSADFANWRRITGVITANSAKTRIYVGAYGSTASSTFSGGDIIEIKNVWLTDLTDIYGAGNEPTAAEFEARFPEEYYDYAPIGSQREITPAQPAQTGDIGIFYNPMKRVDFQLYVDEMIVERGYCQLLAVNRKGRSYTFSVGLYGGLGEFFYNLNTDSDGERRSLADLDFGSDLTFRINRDTVQQNWNAVLGGSLPPVAFVPMHNGTPKTISGDKMLVKGGGLPTSITDGGNTYSTKDGYLLAKLNRKFTEWEIGDLRSYLQRPALRVKDFIAACCNPVNNGGWTVNLDPAFFNADNPYYEKTYLLLPQLNVTEETEDICDDGTVGTVDAAPSTSTTSQTLNLSSACLTIDSNFVDLSAQASNAYLKISVPVQLAVTGLQAQGDLYLTNRVSHHTENKCVCMMLAAYDEQGGLVAVSNRYVFTSKSHRNEIGDLQAPAAPVATSDAEIAGYFTYIDGEYRFRLDENAADTFALTIDKIPRPSSTQHKVKITLYLQETPDGIPTLNRGRYGYNIGNVYINNSQIRCRVLAGSNNSLSLVEPTQYASDSYVYQRDLLSSLDATPLELLLSYTKRFGLLWLQENQAQTVSVYTRGNYYSGEVSDIHSSIDYSKGLKITPVAVKSNNYVLADQSEETTLGAAYKSSYGREYGEIRLKTGYDFGEDKVEMMEKCKFKEVVDGALTGAGYWTFRNADGELPSPVAAGMTVTYYRENGGRTETKDTEYNLFSVTAVSKANSPALGCACNTDDGEESGVSVEPALVFVQGGTVSGSWRLTDDINAMETLNDGPCWLWDRSIAVASVPRFGRVATFDGVTYSLDFGTPRETFYIPEVSLAPEQAIYSRFWENYLADLLSRDTKVAECWVVFQPHLDMRQEMRKFYLFDRCLWVLNKVTDYDATKAQSVKCEFIRVTNKENYK